MKHRIIAVVGLAGFLSGCQQMLVSELRHPGGYPGSVLDKRLVNASNSKSVELLRATMIIAMASRMATATIRDGKDADAFVGYLQSSMQEVNYAASNLYGDGSTTPCDVGDSETREDCRAYYVNFEADVPLVESRIVRLMMASLPEDRVKNFLSDVASGDVLGSAWSGFKALATSANGLRYSAAVFRSNLELAAALGPCSTYSAADGTTVQAAGCFNLPPDKLFTTNTISIPGPVPENAFRSLAVIARTACARLPLNMEGGSTTAVADRNEQCEKIVFEPEFRPITVN